MKNCLNCGKEVIQTPGKKEKKYCDAKCKQQHWHKLKADKKDMVKISREEYEALIARVEDLPSVKELRKRQRNDFVEKISKEITSVKELNKEGSKPYKPKESNESNLTYLQKRQQQKLK